jgi:uncharacterized protein (DUF433 family)
VAEPSVPKAVAQQTEGDGQSTSAIDSTPLRASPTVQVLAPSCVTATRSSPGAKQVRADGRASASPDSGTVLDDHDLPPSVVTSAVPSGMMLVMSLERITIDAAKMDGLPCIRGLRIPVATVLGQLGAGRARDEILADFPDLEPEDILEALRFAVAAVQERELPVLSGS